MRRSFLKLATLALIVPAAAVLLSKNISAKPNKVTIGLEGDFKSTAEFDKWMLENKRDSYSQLLEVELLPRDMSLSMKDCFSWIDTLDLKNKNIQVLITV